MSHIVFEKMIRKGRVKAESQRRLPSWLRGGFVLHSSIRPLLAAAGVPTTDGATAAEKMLQIERG